MLRFLLAASTVLLLALPARAEAAHDALTLTYLPSRTAAPLCPEGDFLVLEVQIRLNYELFQPRAPKHLTVKVERENHGWFRSTGEVRDDDGIVTFNKHYTEIDCTAALVSMAISLAITFTKIPEEPEPILPAPMPPVSNPPVPSPPPPFLPQAAIIPPLVPERYRFQAGIASVFSIGVAPSVIGGVDGFIGVRWTNASLAIEGRALFAPAATLEHVSVRHGYDLSFITIGATGCYRSAWGFACARGEVGGLSISNSVIDNNPGRMSILGLGLRVGKDWLLTPHLAIRVYGETLIQPFRNTLRDTPSSPIIWTQPRMSGSVGLGPVFTFPKI